MSLTYIILDNIYFEKLFFHITNQEIKYQIVLNFATYTYLTIGDFMSNWNVYKIYL